MVGMQEGLRLRACEGVGGGRDEADLHAEQLGQGYGLLHCSQSFLSRATRLLDMYGMYVDNLIPCISRG